MYLITPLSVFVRERPYHLETGQSFADVLI